MLFRSDHVFPLSDVTDLPVLTVLCWSADAQHLTIYFDRPFYENTLLPVTLNITVAWGWFMFFNNTVLTGGILAKIMYVCIMASYFDGRLIRDAFIIGGSTDDTETLLAGPRQAPFPIAPSCEPS